VSTKQVVEVFHFMRVYNTPDLYAREVYWFHKKQGRIIMTANLKNVDQTNMRLLHGPYYRILGGLVTDSGYYFRGTKHGRWEKYHPNGHLADKQHYHKGWFKYSIITYYDAAATKPKEIIPVCYGKKKGTYLSFYENGALAAEGKYDHDRKVGKWIEFYPNKSRKKEVIYPNDPFEEEAVVQITAWDEKGRIMDDVPSLYAQEKNTEITMGTASSGKTSISNTSSSLASQAAPKKEPEMTHKADQDLNTIYTNNTVAVFNKNTNQIDYYTLVISGEANSKEGKISIESPVGKELLGKKVGETCRIRMGSGQILELRIVQVYH
jgi:antitoxin component YwqK of YwqJK toxin-antitoxin module